MIRPALPDDLPALRDIYRRASVANPSDRAALMEHPELLVLDGAAVAEGRTRVAVSGGRQVVGFAATSADGATLEGLFVDPDWVGRGVGRELVSDVVARADGHGVARMDVVAARDAVAFYEALGFVADGDVATKLGTALAMHLDVR